MTPYFDPDDPDVPPLFDPVEYRPIPGFPGYSIGSDRSVRRGHDRSPYPPPWHRSIRGNVRECQINGRSGFVRLRHQGREHVRSVDLLMRAAFAMDPSRWVDRIGPRPRRPLRRRPPPELVAGPIGRSVLSISERPSSPPMPEPSPIPPPVITAAIAPEIPSPAVVYRRVPGFAGYRIGIDRSVWTCLDPGGRGEVGWPTVWRRVAAGRHDGKVVLYRQGRRYVRSVAALHRAAFDPEEFAPELPSGPIAEPVIGSAHGRAKLDEAKVAEARRLRREGWTYNDLARRYDVSENAVYYAVIGRTWRHVPMTAED
jgi:hypothetical protein